MSLRDETITTIQFLEKHDSITTSLNNAFNKLMPNYTRNNQGFINMAAQMTSQKVSEYLLSLSPENSMLSKMTGTFLNRVEWKKVVLSTFVSKEII